MKQFILKTVIFLVFLALLDGLFFSFVDYRHCPDAMLAALIGINAGYLSLLLIPVISPRQSGQRILSGTLYSIGSYYFIAEFTAGMIFMFRPTESIVWPVAVQSVLFAIYVVLLLSSVLANDSTVSSIDKQRQQRMTLNNRADNLKALLDVVQDSECKKLLTRCHHELKSSPIKSSAEVAVIEQEIDHLIMCLNSYVTTNDIENIRSTVTQIRLAVGRRNNQLKHLTQY